jgi:hypothetical protein
MSSGSISRHLPRFALVDNANLFSELAYKTVLNPNIQLKNINRIVFNETDKTAPPIFDAKIVHVQRCNPLFMKWVNRRLFPNVKELYFGNMKCTMCSCNEVFTQCEQWSMAKMMMYWKHFPETNVLIDPSYQMLHGIWGNGAKNIFVERFDETQITSDFLLTDE